MKNSLYFSGLRRKVTGLLLCQIYVIEGILRIDHKLVKGTAFPFTIDTVAAEGGDTYRYLVYIYV